MIRTPQIILFVFVALFVLTSCNRSKKVTKARPPAKERSTSADDRLRTKYAAQLKVPKGQIDNMSLYRFVETWTGTPYRYGGTNQSGVDCSGFTGALYREVYKKTIPRTTKDISKGAKRVSTAHLKEGDIVFFDINGKKSSHIGVYLQNKHFVHASSSKGVIISHLDNPYYQKAFSHGGRF